MTAVRPILDGLHEQARKNQVTMSVPTVAVLVHKLDRLLVDQDVTTFGKWARHCVLCGERIQRGKVVNGRYGNSRSGVAHWRCAEAEEANQAQD